MPDIGRKYAYALEKGGSFVTLRRRLSLNPETYQDVSVLAAVRSYEPQQLVGSIQQGDKEVIIGNSEIAASGWPGPPKKDDRCVIGGKTYAVIAVDSVTVGAETVRHNLTVRG